jgi:glycosyltransferase involved in cell wall biosynthesis
MTDRLVIGIWAEYPLGASWVNQGMTRLVGFLIEGAAQTARVVFRLVVPDWIRSEAETDLRSLRATGGTDFTLHSLSDANPGMAGPPEYTGSIEEHDRYMNRLATFANEHVRVDGWVSIFPFFEHVLDLKRPKAVILPDAIPVVFPESYPVLWREDGAHWRWYRRSREVLSKVDRVITFSQHVASDQAETLFHVPPDKVVVVSHAPPDLSGLLPFVTERRATRETRCEAAGLLRAHARERGWRYLQDFPFEDAPYVVVSTQDRVTKNIGRAAESVRRLLRRDRVDVKLFTTAFVHFGENWTLLPGVIEREQMHRDAVSVHDLPRHVHAALFHCAAAAIHPSFFEGGHGPFPFYEAVSVGTPCLMGLGPHVAELLDEEPGLSPDTFDPYDEDGLARLLRTLLEGGREEVLERQRTIYERLRHRRSWGQVATEYAYAAVAGP